MSFIWIIWCRMSGLPCYRKSDQKGVKQILPLVLYLWVFSVLGHLLFFSAMTCFWVSHPASHLRPRTCPIVLHICSRLGITCGSNLSEPEGFLLSLMREKTTSFEVSQPWFKYSLFVLVFCCCLTTDHKFSSIKHPSYFSLEFCRRKARWRSPGGLG